MSQTLPARTEVRPRPVRGRRTIALLAALLALAVGAVGVGAVGLPGIGRGVDAAGAPAGAEASVAPPAPAPPAQAQAQAHDTGTPTGTPTGTGTGDEATTWSGGRLAVAAWGRSFAVVPVGLAADGALVPPDPVETLGWWSGGATPGAGSGAVVLAVHRDSRADGRGPFAALETLSPGSSVTLDGHSYELTSVETYDKARLPSATLFAQHGPERLVVVTCGGAYDSRSGWDSNVVATFEPPDAA